MKFSLYGLIEYIEWLPDGVVVTMLASVSADYVSSILS